jgi:gamma-glutamyltranspeptidase / glutathione hydrolase
MISEKMFTAGSSFAILLYFIFLPGLSFGQDRVTGWNFASRSEVIATNGMAATSHPLATQIALDILKQGGSAVDAAIAANAALGLMEPTGCGIGGDLFAIIWDEESGSLYGLNATGRSPQSLTRDYFIENGYEMIPQRGALSVSVPELLMDGLRCIQGSGSSQCSRYCNHLLIMPGKDFL